jgi:hypothetical protein
MARKHLRALNVDSETLSHAHTLLCWTKIQDGKPEVSSERWCAMLDRL